MKKSQLITNYFKTLVDHIDSTWKKKKGIGYPFEAKDFKRLKKYSAGFQEWGLMALWDVFMWSTSEWVIKSGYSLDAFFRCIPWLVDDPSWKKRAADYEKKLFPPAPNFVLELFDTSKCNFGKASKSTLELG